MPCAPDPYAAVLMMLVDYALANIPPRPGIREKHTGMPVAM